MTGDPYGVPTGYVPVSQTFTGTPGGANREQVGGDHYKSKAVQPWDYIIDNKLGYLEGNIVKYVTRYAQKGGKQDLLKAQHYLDKLLEVVG